MRYLLDDQQMIRVHLRVGDAEFHTVSTYTMIQRVNVSYPPQEATEYLPATRL
jgi:hypothetical protein